MDAFIDGDEFILPTGERGLAEFLEQLPEHAGAVFLNWAVFGSSGRIEPGDGFIVERFQKRAPQGFNSNYLGKVIMRPCASAGHVSTPHHLPLREGFSVLAATGEPVAYRPDTVGFTSAVLWDNFRLNHYVIKSWREYWFKKKSRGRMSLAGGQHHRMYFASHDRNDEIDTAAASRVPELAQYYGALVDIVQKAGLSIFHRR